MKIENFQLLLSQEKLLLKNGNPPITCLLLFPWTQLPVVGRLPEVRVIGTRGCHYEQIVAV